MLVLPLNKQNSLADDAGATADGTVPVDEVAVVEEEHVDITSGLEAVVVCGCGCGCDSILEEDDIDVETYVDVDGGGVVIGERILSSDSVF